VAGDSIRRGSRLALVARIVMALIAGSVWLIHEEFPWWVLLNATLMALVFLSEAISKYMRGAGDDQPEHSSEDRRQ
jgi:predicted alpha/beta hydrolase